MTPESALKAFLTQPRLAHLPKVLAVACSGGADSVALLRSAAETAPALGWRVEALHCDHGLRREAKADAAFVAALCAELGVPLQAFAKRVGKGPGMEARARAWRQACYARAATQAGARLVLLGQHAQDQAETLLLNLVRGAGPRGAAAMLALSPLQGAPRIQLGRPFLALSPQTLRAWLKRKRQPWREDASNRDTRLVRNRLRHGVMPELLKVNPKAVEHLAAFAASLAPAKKTRDLAGLLQLDRAARARASQVLAQGQGQADLGRGWTLQVGQGRGRLLQALAPLRLRLGPWQAWGPAWRFRLKLAAVTARNLKQDKAFWFPAHFAKKALRVRAAAAGDRIQAFGLSSGSKLLMDCLAEAKVPAWQRRDWPVLVLGAQILALPPWRRSRLAPVQTGSKALCLQWSRVPALSGQA